jgi:biopolymer transport protein ExbD
MSELLPARKRRRGISLTPLVDVIFLLLIFFMLTSQIAPFSLISFAKTTIDNEAEQVNLPDTAKLSQQALGALITVLSGGISVNGQRTAHSNIDNAMTNLRQAGVTNAIIAPRSAASVQDLITVLEAVKKANFATIRIRKSN